MTSEDVLRMTVVTQAITNRTLACYQAAPPRLLPYVDCPECHERIAIREDIEYDALRAVVDGHLETCAAFAELVR